MPPLGDAGKSVVAHFCNANMAAHQGKLEAVYNTKIYDAHPPQECYKYLVNDFEGGRADSIQPYPWQTDTCIGNWHYYRGAKYRTADDVIKELIDVVSKNGNLLLNIPLKGDGSPDDEELTFLAELTKWMDINGEGIFGTRPWKVFGEGVAAVRGEAVPGKTPNTREIRFTSKGRRLYAYLLAIPQDDITIRSLRKSVDPASRAVAKVELLGSDEKLDWKQRDDGLVIKCPAVMPCEHAIALRITFADGKDPMDDVKHKAPAAEKAAAIALVPQPREVQRGPGQFALKQDTAILVDKDAADAASIARLLTQRIRASAGLDLKVSTSDSPGMQPGAIRLTTRGGNASLGREGYQLEVTPDGAVITGGGAAGMFYGTQTLLQLLPPQVFSTAKVQEPMVWTIPVVRINDQPRFVCAGCCSTWRGISSAKRI